VSRQRVCCVRQLKFRIGVNLSLHPKKVYLHCGTRIGAKNLGLDYQKHALEMTDLPQELQKLKPYQVEDFLCIYKDALKNVKPAS
jgi:hypothetical protein